MLARDFGMLENSTRKTGTLPFFNCDILRFSRNSGRSVFACAPHSARCTNKVFSRIHPCGECTPPVSPNIRAPSRRKAPSRYLPFGRRSLADRENLRCTPTEVARTSAALAERACNRIYKRPSQIHNRVKRVTHGGEYLRASLRPPPLRRGKTCTLRIISVCMKRASCARGSHGVEWRAFANAESQRGRADN